MAAYETVTGNLGKLNRAELEAVADLVAAMLAELEEAPEAGHDQAAAGNGGKAGKGGGSWLETRTVNGCGPYVYRRWRDANGKKHSEYLGKANAAK